LINKDPEYYLKILGVNRYSSKQDIKIAFRKLIKQQHPDKFQNDKNAICVANKKSQLINEAYSILKHYQPPNLKKLNDYSPHYSRQGDKKRMHDIGRVDVKSSNIKSVGYDKDNNLLQIEFRNGYIYEYFNIPKGIFIGLLDAESKGRFGNRYIFYSYYYERVK
jgi:DnaJ-class molecular chaperone